MNAGGSWRPGLTPEEEREERRRVAREKAIEAAWFCAALVMYAALWAMIFRALTD